MRRFRNKTSSRRININEVRYHHYAVHLIDCPLQKYVVVVFLDTLLSLSGNSGYPTQVRLQQPQEQRYPVLQMHAGFLCVSVRA